eukprot:2027347-Pyramimonas_sp.AAC.1
MRHVPPLLSRAIVLAPLAIPPARIVLARPHCRDVFGPRERLLTCGAAGGSRSAGADQPSVRKLDSSGRGDSGIRESLEADSLTSI